MLRIIILRDCTGSWTEIIRGNFVQLDVWCAVWGEVVPFKAAHIDTSREQLTYFREDALVTLEVVALFDEVLHAVDAFEVVSFEKWEDWD